MRFQAGTLRNQNLTETYLSRYRKQKLNGVNDTHLLDEVGDYHGTQYEKSVYESDGTAKIESVHIAAQTVISKEGTATVTVVSGELQIGIGWVGNIVLSDGTLYHCEERIGTIAFDASGNGNHGDLTGGLTHTTVRELSLVNYTNEVGYSLGVNQFEQSENLIDSYWGLFRLTRTLSIIENGIQLTNLEATEDNNNGSALTKSVGLAAIGIYTISCYAKASDSDFINLRVSDNADFVNRVHAWFNIANGTIETVDSPGNSFDLATANIELIGSGLYRCSLTFSINVDIANLSCRFYVCDGDGSRAVSIGASIDVGGTQLQKGGLSNYQKTIESPTIGSIVPCDESNSIKDVFGNDLQFVGKVASDMKLVNSNCIELDGVVGTEAVFNFDCTGLSITSYEGTSVPTFDTANDKITFTAGTFYNLVLSNGYHFPIAEGSGTTSYAKEDETKQISWIGGATWSTQNNYHFNINNGFTKGVNKIDYSEDFNQWDTNYAPKSEFLTSGFTDPFGGDKAFRINNSLGQNFTLQRQITDGVQGQYYTFSMWIKSNTGQNISRSLLYGNNLSNFLTLNVTPEWQRFSISIPYNVGYSTWGIYSITGEIDILIAFAQHEESYYEMTDYQKTTGSPTAGANLPYPIDGAYTNPSCNGHNGAETDVTMPVGHKDLYDSAFHYDQADLSSEVKTYSDLTDTNNQVFVQTITDDKGKVNIETFLPANAIFKWKRFVNGFRNIIGKLRRN